MSAPILAHFNPDRPIKLETDASDFALGAVLSQLNEEDGKWHPVAYHSRKFQPAEINYDVHDKEMTAIVAAFKEWDHLLPSAADQIVIYTDHKNLEYFNSTKILNRRQHRWAEFLQPFNFRVIYREGRLNEKADALSRRRDYRLEGGGNSRSDQERTFFNPGQCVASEERNILQPRVLQACQKFRLESNFLNEIEAGAAKDDLYEGIRKGLQNQDKMIDSNFSIEKNLLLYKSRWYIPDNQGLKHKIMEAEHDSRIAGHFGTYKTLGKVKANFYWPKMEDYIIEYVRTCDTCQRSKSIRHKKFGLLEPLDVPIRPWNSVSMDFIIGLPESEGYTKIWVIVDRFSKMAHFIPLATDQPIKELALIFLKEVWRLHGLPESIISDRDSRFTSKFWRSLMNLLQVKLSLSTAFHPESDGQTERVNQTLEQYLRAYCSYQQDDWVSLLPLAEYAYNTSTSESTKVSPFEINHGFNPRTNWSGIVPDSQSVHPSGELLVKDWEGTWQDVKETLQRAQQRQRKWHDQKRLPSPDYITLEDVQKGIAKKADRVMLNRKNIRTKRPMEKLDQQMFGPFVVKRKVGTRAYEIELPSRWSIHPVFNVGLLEPYREDPSGLRNKEVPLPDVVDNEPSYVIVGILDSRWYGGVKQKFPQRFVQYLVAWEGYGPEENSWEPFEMLEGTGLQAIEDFHKDYPTKPRDYRFEVGVVTRNKRKH